MAQEIIVKKTIKKNEKMDLLKFGVFRTPRGVEVYVKSEFIENHFKEYGLSEGGEREWSGSKPYNYPSGLVGNFNYMFDNWKGGLFVDRSEQGTPNLSMLRAVGISEGKRFLIEDSIYSQTEIKRFGKIFRENVDRYFQEYLKPVNVSIEMVFSINESD